MYLSKKNARDPHSPYADDLRAPVSALAGIRPQSQRADYRLRFRRWLLLSQLSWLGASLGGFWPSCAAAATEGRPGETDPIAKPSRRSLFPDHELMAFLPSYPETGLLGSAAAGLALNRDSGDFVPVGAAPNSLPVRTPPLAAVTGRILTEGRDQVAIARRTGANVSIWLLPQGTRSLRRSALLPGFSRPPSGSTEFVDLVAADVDNAADAQGRYHDEVVVCHATAASSADRLQIMVTVLDYNGGQLAAPTVTRRRSSGFIDTSAFQERTSGKIHPVDNVVACAAGDFDGDGRNEIALAHLQDATTLRLSLFRYRKDRQGIARLREISQTSLASTSYFIGTMDLVAADFNGDGKDELAAAAVSWYPSFEPLLYAQAQFFDTDGQLAVRHRGSYREPYQFFLPGVPSVRIQAVAGLFKFAPADGFDFSRRQLALVFPPPSPFGGSADSTLRVLPLEPEDDLSTAQVMSCPKAPGVIGPPLQTSFGGPSGNRFAVAAGNFQGYVEGRSPLWNLMLSGWNADGALQLTRVNFESPGCVAQSGSPQTVAAPVLPVLGGARPALVAYDHDGDSLYVGAPVHFTLTDLARTDFIIQEPPKHLAYVGGRIRNVSRRGDFFVELRDSQSASFATRSTNKTDFGFGTAVEISAKDTVSSSGNIGIAKFEGEVSLEQTARFSYDYDEHREAYNSSYAERTLSFTGQTNADDYLVSQIQLFDIWRYRAYGARIRDRNGDEAHAFLELVFPGPRLEARGGGLTFDWYQPIHENGNILSYPVLTARSSTPPDLGSFRLPGGPTLSEPLIPPQLLNYDGTSGEVRLDFTASSGAGSAREYSHTLGASLDIGVSASASAEFSSPTGSVGGSSERSVNASLTGDVSWGNLTTNDNTTSESTGITLSKPFNGDATRSYPFAPSVYVARDGTFKVTHTVGGLNGPDSWWQQIYGRKPDPALNLPRRFVQNLNGVWLANRRDSRKRMRGFFACQAIGRPTSPCGELTRVPPDGESVRLQARVYNYSTARTAQDVLVRFFAVPYDSAENREVGPRRRIGQTRVARLSPREMKVAAIDWDTSGFGPATGTGSTAYRIYVVLDPANAIDEIYDTEPRGTIDPGQNNEGWGLVSIAAAERAAGSVAATEAARAAVRGLPPSHLAVDAVLARDPRNGALTAEEVVARVGEPLPVRIHVAGNRDDTRVRRLLLLARNNAGDSEPKVVIGTTVQGVAAAEGAYVWVDWTPQEAGEFDLSAVVADRALESDGAASLGRLSLRVRADHESP